ncbi:hypothetical protein Bhyg_14210 [Pseudolycoriella hygida]|uniref:Uncharacterized protein n=1 Tax=Pseudolycoriella hygida TaxID=35572 RepID=A0A9Q0MRG3_9DIPT|nr:hypothetical protein Bhyg_14210 [Pseudolycoriella hygida]
MNQNESQAAFLYTVLTSPTVPKWNNKINSHLSHGGDDVTKVTKCRNNCEEMLNQCKGDHVMQGTNVPPFGKALVFCISLVDSNQTENIYVCVCVYNL